MPSYPRINGHVYSFASIEVSVNQTIFTGFTEITYTQTLEPGVFRATRSEKLARTRGELNVEGSFSLVKDDYQEMIDELGEGYMEASIDFTVNYREINSPLITDVLTGARITSEEDSHSQGTDALVVACDMDILFMTRNGILPILGQLT